MIDIGTQHSGTTVPAPGMLPLLDLPPRVALDVQPHEVVFRQLRGRREIGEILHLRDEIKLPASALGDAAFATREKKETKSVWWALFSGKASSSVPSGCCP
ncbi:MAG TPA: hypothetical protein VIL30_19900 [Ramlibacter sp.]|jgi:hypothetical protein